MQCTATGRMHRGSRLSVRPTVACRGVRRSLWHPPSNYAISTRLTSNEGGHQATRAPARFSRPRVAHNSLSAPEPEGDEQQHGRVKSRPH
jgi:hypothetical protein